METITLFTFLCCIGLIAAYNGQEAESDKLQDDVSYCKGNGPIVSNNPCSSCFCRNNRKTCVRTSCNKPVPRGCSEVKVPGQCCPEIRCPDPTRPEQETDSENYGGDASYQQPESDKLQDESYCTGNGPIVSENPCSICFCRNKRKTCTRQSCNNAVPRGCSEVNVPGKCCPEIRCPEPTRPEQETDLDNYGDDSITPRDDPSSVGKCFGEGEIPNVNPCNKCSCRNGRKICPAWNCPNRISGPNCRFVKIPDQCCPKEECDMVTMRPPTSECASGDGPIFHSNPCNKCKCRSGVKICAKIRCQEFKITEGCKIQKIPGQCCPRLICSRIKPGSGNYEKDEDTVDVSQITGCKANGPIRTNNPCERCSCYKGSKRCTKMSCPAVQPGCYATNNPGQCCPKIECDISDPIKKY